jgi:hypothetical protein
MPTGGNSFHSDAPVGDFVESIPCASTPPKIKFKNFGADVDL